MKMKRIGPRSTFQSASPLASTGNSNRDVEVEPASVGNAERQQEQGALAVAWKSREVQEQHDDIRC
jgi:hypothetical protein